MFTLRSSRVGKFLWNGVMILAMLTLSLGTASAARAESSAPSSAMQVNNYAIVFVSRQIPTKGSVYYQEGGSMPGVMPYGRFQVAAPGKLIVREANGTLRILVDGSNPTAASLNLIDVNAPDVSYDGKRIVFAGIPSGSYSNAPMGNPGAWRLYVINVDGTGLRQLTFSDQNVNLSQFKGLANQFSRYDDTDPAWLPDGRVVFSSTRWPSFGMYGAARTSNLYVVNADGSGLHRITSERNGADRPIVDPLTGKIVYSRWWRNLRVATDDMGTIPDPRGGYIMKDGLCAINSSGTKCFEPGGKFTMERNSWHLASINPDGTGLVQFAGRSNTTFYGTLVNHAYGGSFAPDGSFYANFFPMTNGTEASGFGGIRRYQRGPNGYTAIIGITTRDESVQQFVKTNPNSYGVYVGNYAGEPEVLPDGRLVISWAQDAKQDYGLYTINADGSGLTKIYDNLGATELRARVIRSRPAPPIIPDKVTKVASLLPPLEQGPYDIDGKFTFQALNVYFNAPVDVDIINAMPVGSANSIRFFIDHQRSQQTGSIEAFDWPILLEEVLINPNGSVTSLAPANVPLFEQIRTIQPGYDVPLTGSNALPAESGGAAHVAGENFGRPGQVASCVGCHAGHTLIPVPANPADAQWTNLATGATVTVSSTGAGSMKGINDRRVQMSVPKGTNARYWASGSGSPNTQWVQLTFPVPVTVRTVRLYNPSSADSSIKVLDATVRLFSDAAGTQEVASNNSGTLTAQGTNVNFNEVLARAVRIQFNSVNGNAAALGEVEVIARAEAPDTVSVPTSTPTMTAAATTSATPTETQTTTTATVTETETPTLVSGSSPTATYTPSATLPSAFTATSTATPTTTSVPTASPTNTPTNTSTATFTPTATPTRVVPTNTKQPTTLPPNTLILTPAKLDSQKGTTAGSLASLGLLQQKGAEDDPSTYVTFQTPNTEYSGYQTFYLPTGVNASQVTAMVLDVNYKAPPASTQLWSVFIYNWNSKKWVKLSETKRNTGNDWQRQVLPILNFKRYISTSNEIRIQIRSNNANGDVKLDYEVVQILLGSAPPASQSNVTQTASPQAILPSPTPAWTNTAAASPTPNP